ncbi:MAG: CPBP family intramembrane metalloprotease [Clostridium argentinense]|uniref:CPBP family intramembrane metalloprotease n=1 Tax=Clostridium faecium TaxID=2762223 RepID=A0ABR8YNJ1_9CLOT|nr:MULTISPECIES: CPBP family intramembrane glutamic endopeptidase [Clostridium]MBD8045785.1 CPBP family intramembrane metalloprotease [Clostridium faecium]MBS5822587.1 CPBP family intramembrane metalloprotease [Clostridium argentinense]MDU1347848.1 CPBP family intramembrane glutamic endopeptidase [Clostridium argentinense]
MIIMTLLLFLRFPFVFAVIFKIIPLDNDTMNMIFTNSTYLLTSILIIYERKNLLHYNFTFFSMVLFTTMPVIGFLATIFTKDFQRIQYYNLQYNFLDYISLIVAVFLLILLISRKFSLQKKSLNQVIVELIIAIVLGVLLSFLITGFRSIDKLRYIKISQVLPVTLFQFNYAAISEEPLFRGFIWGYLRKFQWKELWILIFQSTIFMLGHIYYLGNYPIFVFIRTFIVAFIFGVIVWKFRSIANSMIAHSIVNSLSQFIEHL